MARRLRVEYPGGIDHVLVLPGERRQIQCVLTNAAWNAPSNLVTITKSLGFANGSGQSVVAPDGTATISVTLTNSANTYEGAIYHPPSR